MAKLEWGKKRICSACGLKYYDFNKSPIKCPTCDEEFDPDLFLKSRKGKSLSSKVGASNNVNSPDIEDVEIEAAEEAVTDDDVIIDLNKDIKDSDNEAEAIIENNTSFIDEDHINGEDAISVDIEEDEKDEKD